MNAPQDLIHDIPAYMDHVGVAAQKIHRNEHEGKLGVLVLAPEEGLGVTDPVMRERLLDQITLFRRGS